MKTKKCSCCKRKRVVTDFHLNRAEPDGYARQCKECRSKARKNCSEEARRSQISSAVAWQKKNQEAFREYQRQWRRDNAKRLAVSAKWSRLKCKYGVTKEGYGRMLAERNGGCHICGRSPPEVQLHVDHCHESNKVRGLLCGHCNKAIGMFQDDVKRMQEAIEYLMK